jgi:hypothetical protein
LYRWLGSNRAKSFYLIVKHIGSDKPLAALPLPQQRHSAAC